MALQKKVTAQFLLQNKSGARCRRPYHRPCCGQPSLLPGQAKPSVLLGRCLLHRKQTQEHTTPTLYPTTLSPHELVKN